MIWPRARRDAQLLVEVSEYDGGSAAVVAATQLGDEYSERQRRRIVDEWVAFFEAGPTPVRDLEFVTRTPRRLFEALAGQTQLERLRIKWGDYSDLAVVDGLSNLRRLELGGASAVTTLDPLCGLTALDKLLLEGLRDARDLSPLEGLRAVRHLELGGDWMAPRIAHVDSIAFLRELKQVERLVLHTLIVDDGDYSPLLDLPKLRSVRVMETSIMSPNARELKKRPPWRS